MVAYYSPITGELPLYYGGGSGLRVTVTAAGYYVIVGDDEDEDGDGVYAAFYGPVGNLVIDKFLVNSATRGDQFEPEIAALAGGGFVIVWTHYDPDAEGGYVNEIRGQVFDANGQPAGTELIIAADTNRSDGYQSHWTPVITALDDGNFVVAWEVTLTSSKYAIEAQVFNAGGQAVTGIIAVHPETNWSQENPEIRALSGGRFLVSWLDYSSRPTATTHRYQIFEESGAAVGPSFLISDAVSDVSRIGLGRFVVVTERGGDIYAQIFGEDGIAIGDAFRVNTQVSGTQLSAKVGVLTDGSFIIAWVDQGATGGPLVKTQGFEATGIKISDEQVVAVGYSVIAVQGDTGGGFAVTYNGSAQGVAAVEMVRFGPVVHVPLESLFSGGDDDVVLGALTDDQRTLIERLHAEDRLDELYRAYTGDDWIELPNIADYQLSEHVRWDPTQTFDASDGDDVVTLGDGDDKVSGGTGDDYIVSLFGGQNVIDGGLGYDEVDIFASPATDATLTANATGDLFTATGSGYATSTTRITGVERVWLFGVTIDLSAVTSSATSFVLYDSPMAQTLIGSRQGDTFNMTPRATGNDVLTGGGGADYYSFRGGLNSTKSEIITDFDGNDVIDLRPGSNQPTLTWLGTGAFTNAAWQARYVKMGGQTIIQFDRDGDGVVDRTITLANGEFDLSSLAGTPYLYMSTTQAEQFGGAGKDTLIGTRGGDAIRAFAGNDVILLSGGVDFIDGGAGNDVLVGALGQLPFFAPPGAAQVYTIGEKSIVSSGGTIRSWFAGVEKIALDTTGTGDFGDTIDARGFGGTIELTLGAGNDTVFGTASNDVIDGGAGNDMLDGGAGADRMIGGTGDDIYYVDDLGDVVVELKDGGIDTIVTAMSYQIKGQVENLTLTGTDDIDGIGNALDNILTGNDGDNALSGSSGNDVLIGGGGNDRLNGGMGDDRMEGGAGDDLYIVGAAGDVVVELAGGGYDTVFASVDYVLGDHVEKLTLKGAARAGTGNALDNTIVGSNGPDVLRGMAGDDTLLGGLGADTLEGGDGNDALTGGEGRDILTGGAGADTFIFADGHMSTDRAKADRITDFSKDEGDRINLRKVDADVTVAGDQNFTFIGRDSFTGHAGELRFERVGAETFVMGDTNGDGVADFLIRVADAVNFVAKDFVL